MPSRRRTRQRRDTNPAPENRFMTRREFHSRRRNLTFSQCHILQWTRRSTRMMLIAMMMYGVPPEHSIFRAHIHRHQMLGIFLQLGAQPYNDQLREMLPALTQVFYQTWHRCVVELERFGAP